MTFWIRSVVRIDYIHLVFNLGYNFLRSIDNIGQYGKKGCLNDIYKLNSLLFKT